MQFCQRVEKEIFAPSALGCTFCSEEMFRATVIFIVVAGALIISETAALNHPKIVLHDSFDNQQLDQSLWDVVDNTDVGTGDGNLFTRASAETKDGHLSLNARAATVGYYFTVGAIRSHQTFLYGNFTWKAKAAPGAGVSSALRLFAYDETSVSGITGGNNTSINIAMRGKRKVDTVELTSFTDKGGNFQYDDTLYNLAQEFHTFTILWEPEQVALLVDGEEITKIAEHRNVPNIRLHVGMQMKVEQGTKLSPTEFSIDQVTVAEYVPPGANGGNPSDPQSMANVFGVLLVLIFSLI